MENDSQKTQAHTGLLKDSRLGLIYIKQGPRSLFGKGPF